jgi:hypothetical protein
VHTLVSGVTAEDDWTYGRVVRPLPALWVRDGSGRWHATRTNGVGPAGNSGEVIPTPTKLRSYQALKP